MEAVAVVAAGRIASGRDSNALIGDRPVRGGFRELCDDPAIGELIVKHHRVAVAESFAAAAESGPDGRDAIWSKHRCSGALIEYLISLVNNLDVLGFSDRAVRVGRRAVT